MSFTNTEQAEFWAARAESWMSLESYHEQLIGPAGRMAIECLAPQRGQHLIDLGCGTGLTTLELARRVAPAGRAVGVDIAAALLARAGEYATAAGVANVEFRHADVQSSDLGHARFDGAFSRFGVMFFADPVSAFGNVRRSLRADAVLCFVCWQPLASNEWMLIPAQAASSALGQALENPPSGTPGPFSLSDPEDTRRILAGAGFHDIGIEDHSDVIEIAEQAIPGFVDSSLRVGAVQRMLTDAEAEGETVERVRSAIDRAVRARVQTGHVALSRSVWLVRAEA